MQRCYGHCNLPYAAAYLLPFLYVQNDNCLFPFVINTRRLQAVVCWVKLYYSLTLLWYFRRDKIKKTFFKPAEFFSADHKLTPLWLCLAHNNSMESENYQVSHGMLHLGASCYCLKKKIVNFSFWLYSNAANRRQRNMINFRDHNIVAIWPVITNIKKKFIWEYLKD